MPPTCAVCRHPERASIDKAIVDGLSLRNIAQRFDGPSAWGIHRHKQHAHALLAEAMHARDSVLAERLYRELTEGVAAAGRGNLEDLRMLRSADARTVASIIERILRRDARIIARMARLLKDAAGPRSG
jgi:hypothetical protein